MSICVYICAFRCVFNHIHTIPHCVDAWSLPLRVEDIALYVWPTQILFMSVVPSFHSL